MPFPDVIRCPVCDGRKEHADDDTCGSAACESVFYEDIDKPDGFGYDRGYE